ncbi:hypothetical protein M422DRAFT_70276, partial [Sphaerobolus stellatus SS14]
MCRAYEAPQGAQECARCGCAGHVIIVLGSIHVVLSHPNILPPKLHHRPPQTSISPSSVLRPPSSVLRPPSSISDLYPPLASPTHLNDQCPSSTRTAYTPQRSMFVLRPHRPPDLNVAVIRHPPAPPARRPQALSSLQPSTSLSRLKKEETGAYGLETVAKEDRREDALQKRRLRG